MLTFTAIFTALLYFAATGLQALIMLKKPQIKASWVCVISLLAIIIHAVLLHRWIDVGAGQNLTFFNTLSQIFWFAALLSWLIALRRPSLNLTIILYPLAGISIILVLFFSGSYIINIKEDPRAFIHILLSFLALSILIIASIQAIFLGILNQALRKKYSNVLTQSLPPLQRMESLLFQLIAVGFCSLTAVIITGISFFPGLFHRALWHHMVFAFFAWVIFGILIIGRVYFGWRGRTAIRWTLAGVVLLLLAYLTSQVLGFLDFFP